jgi:hypothetical protein
MGKVLKKRLYNGGTMTESMYWSRIRSALRSAFRYWVPAQNALNKASRKSQNVNTKIKKEYQCNKCKEWYKRSEVEIDHVVECGSLKKYSDLVPFLKKLTVEDVNGFQVLCKPCHKEKGLLYKKEKKQHG